MAAIMDSVELLELLDSTELHVFNEVRKLILENLSNNKDAWLVNALVDSFTVSHSPRCLEIIVKITEPHDKHVLDRLLDHMKGSGAVNHKMEAMLILSNIVRHEPLWLHKLSSHPILVHVIKCLKTETDVCILMIGCLMITTLLPNVPVAIVSHLPDIFDVFLRLSSFTVNKAGGMIKAHRLHLHVGIQCMFHRLYGMYPCNFLAYLRAAFCRPENKKTFEEIIRPLLSQIRMHPLLVTAAKDKELSKERWREMEVHDVVVECAQLALDPVGMELLTSPIKHKPDTSSSKTVDRPIRGGFSTLSAFVDPSSAWSPSRVTGLSTPPSLPSSSASGASGGTKKDSSGKKELGILDSPLRRLTSLNTGGGGGPPPSPRWLHSADSSQPSTPRLDKFEPSFNTEQISRAACKLSFETPMTDSQIRNLPELASNLQLLAAAAAPACASAAELAAAAPACASAAAAETDTAAVSQTKKAAASQEAERAVAAEEADAAADAAAAGSSGTDSSTAGDGGGGGEAGGGPTGSLRATMTTSSTQTSLNEAIRSEATGDSTETSTVSVGSCTEDDLTGYSRTHTDNSASQKPDPADLHPSAASVAAFMKKVKRIRYSSHRTSGTDSNSGSASALHRSESMFGSCPSLLHIPEGATITTSSDSGDELSETDIDLPGTRAGPHSAGLLMKRSTDRPVSRTSLVTPTLVTVGLSPVVANVACAETQTSYYAILCDSYKDPTPVSGAQIGREDEERRDMIVASELENLLGQLLPVAAYVQCYSCASRGAGRLCEASDVQYGALALKTGCITPMYLTYSPKDILDHHIRYSIEVHGKQYSKAKEESELAALSSSATGGSSSSGGGGSAAVSAGGGVSSRTAADDSCHVTLLHNLLMFTQHRQEVHARRNRRLLGRAVKVVSLEEQNAAMKDQLKLQEEELSSLRRSLTDILLQNSDLKSKVDCLTKEKVAYVESTTEQIIELKNLVDDMNNSLSAQKSENEQLVMKLDMANNTLFSREKELALLMVKAEGTSLLREQVNQLNREILLMGELHSKYQQRLSAVSSNPSEKAQLRNFMQAAKNECMELKTYLKETSVQLKAEKIKSVSYEKQLQEKDSCISELKKLLEATKSTHHQQIQDLERKLKAERVCVVSEQRRAMELMGELQAVRETPIIRRGKRCDVSTSPLSSPPPPPSSYPSPRRPTTSPSWSAVAGSAAITPPAPGGATRHDPRKGPYDPRRGPYDPRRGSDEESSPESALDAALICDTNQGILPSD